MPCVAVVPHRGGDGKLNDVDTKVVRAKVVVRGGVLKLGRVPSKGCRLEKNGVVGAIGVTLER